jgi:PAS domain S-box-containing protein
MAEKIRALYVDDESTLLDLCKMYLERVGEFIVTTVTNAPEAIRILELKRFDVIVSDYQMPEMDGIEFLKIVRSRGDKTPFIIFTGRGREEVVIEALNAGADFYIQKGGEPKSQFTELAHKIKKAVEGRQAERAFVESERKYRHLIEHADEAIVVAQDGMLRLVNHKTIEATGYSEQELLSMPFSAIIHPDDRAMLVERYQKRLKGGELPSHYTFRISPKGASTRWVEISAVVIDWEGRPATLNFLTDITERKRAEELLRESEEKYRRIVDTAEEGIWLLDDHFRITYTNRRMAEMLGYSPEEMIGKEIRIFMPAEELADHGLRTKQQREGACAHFERRFMRKNGSILYTAVSVTPVKDADGNFLGSFAMYSDITERKQAEELLRVSEERFREQYQNTPLAIFMWQHRDGDFILVDCNKAAKTITGGRANDFIGKTASEMYETRPEILSEIRHAFSQQTGISKELISEHFLPGRLISTTATCIPPNFIMVHMEDITDRKKAEDALRQSEARYRNLVETSPDVIWEMDVQGNFTYVSPQCTERMGYSPADLIGKPMISLIPEEHRSRVRDLFMACVAGKDISRYFEMPVEYRDGHRRIVEIRPSPLLDDNGKIRGLSGIALNVTERKRMEEALRESEERYRNVVEDQTEFISRFLPDGTHVFVNDAYCRYFGKTHDEIIGHRFVPNIPKEDQKIVREHFRSLTPENPVATVVHRIIMPDGLVRWQRWSDRAIFDTTGNIVEYQSVGRDFTENKQTEEALALASKKLNLLSSITRHDIQNQLYALRGYLDISHDFLNDPGKLREFLEKEEKAAVIIEEQITFTKQYQEMGVSAPAWQNVNASIEKAQKQFLMSDVRVEVNCPDLDVFADSLFEKVFYNLIDNALHYGGDHMKTIRVSAQESDAGLTITYEDDGVGITEEDKKRLFTKGFGKHTGLGLFLSREILSITGITITENGIPGKGARFEIRVPKGMYRFTGTGEM